MIARCRGWVAPRKWLASVVILASAACSDDTTLAPAPVTSADASLDVGPDASFDGGTDARSAPAPRFVYNEHEFEGETDLRASLGSSLIVNLEHPDGVDVHPLDSASTGEDTIPIHTDVEETREYCWPGEPGGPPHLMLLRLVDGEELARIEEGGACVEVTIPAGELQLVLRHGGGREGRSDTIFLRPPINDARGTAPEQSASSGMRTLSGSATSTCALSRTAQRGTMNLKSGEVAVFGESSPTDTSKTYVFDGNCNDLSPFLTVGSVATGPDTMVMVYHSADFSGAMTRMSSPTPTTLSGSRVPDADEQFTNTKMSLRVWTNANPATNCQVSRAGLVGDSEAVAGVTFSAEELAARRGRDEISLLKDGEVALYSKPNFQGFAVVFTGSCANLDTICFAGEGGAARSLKVANNMVATVYADANFAGYNWPYNASVAELPDTLWRSLQVESLSSFNTRKTLLSTNNCMGCMLKSAKLADAKLAGVVLTNATLTGADLRRAVLTDAKLSNAIFDGAWMIDVDMQRAIASSASFRGALLNGANLNGAQFDGAFFNAAGAYPAAQLNYAYMPNANLKNAALDGASMTYVDLYGGNATVEGATMRGTDLTNALLTELVFGKVHMEGASLTGAVLINANVVGAFLNKARMIGAHLEGADFTGATLYGANLTHAVVASDAGSYAVQVLPNADSQSTVPRQYNFSATTLPGTTTDKDSLCPNGLPGPCNTPESLKVDGANKPAQPPCVTGDEFCGRRTAQ